MPRERRISGPDRDSLTLEQCAEYIGVSPDTLEIEIERRRFPPGAVVGKRKRLWTWMDCVAYLHLVTRWEELPDETAKRTSKTEEN